MKDEPNSMLDVAVEACTQAGKVLLGSSAASRRAEAKSDQYNVVTEADLKAEALLLDLVHRHFPSHSTLAEESGLVLRDPNQAWIIDPLDGTSNFASGLPWFGVLIAHVRNGHPDLAVMYLPYFDELYVAERGRGARRNGAPISVCQAGALSEVLWAYGMDDPGTGESGTEKLKALRAVLHATRNVRATNCLLDAAYTADGRFGGMLNWSCRIWDIAAPSLIVQEAGGLYTDVDGAPIHFALTEAAAQRQYAVLAAAPPLHVAMRTTLAAARRSDSYSLGTDATK